MADSTPPIRIAHVINQLGPAGAERSLAELIPHLQRANIEPVVVSLHPIDAEWAQDAHLTCEVRFLRGNTLARRVVDLQGTLLRGRFDLVHTTLFPSDVLGRIAAVIPRIPVLTSLVNTSYEPVRFRDPNVRRRRLVAVREIDKWTARFLTTHFHAITSAVRDSAVRTLGIDPSRVTVIHRGRDPDRFPYRTPERRARARKKLGLNEHDEVIINVARREYQKGQRGLVDALALLEGRHQRLHALIAGRDGHASRSLRQPVQEKRLTDRVRFLGNRSDVSECLAAADVFAFPSLYEGLGGAVLEAMATGLPVVASDLPALREIIEHERSGLLVPPDDPQQLALALSRLLDSASDARKLGDRGHQLFREKFTLETSARRMIGLYTRLAHRSKRLHPPAD